MSEYKGIRGWKVQTVSTDPAASVLATGTWASGTNYPQNIRGSAAAGVQTASLNFGGVGSPANSYLGLTNSYDGTTWTLESPLSTGRSFIAGTGTVTAALAFGGENPQSNSTEEFDGSTWTAGGNLPTAGNGYAGSGTQTNAVASHGSGGYTYNGTSWSATSGMNSARSYSASGGGASLSTTAIAAAGYSGPTGTVASSETYDGTSWTTITSMSYATAQFGGAGTTTSFIGIGGSAPAWPGRSTKTEFWNGSSWTELNDLANYRQGNSGSGNTTAALTVGGEAPTPTDNYANNYVEEWNVSPPASFSKENLGQVYYNSTSNAFKVTKTVYGTGAWASGATLKAFDVEL